MIHDVPAAAAVVDRIMAEAVAVLRTGATMIRN